MQILGAKETRNIPNPKICTSLLIELHLSLRISLCCLLFKKKTGGVLKYLKNSTPPPPFQLPHNLTIWGSGNGTNRGGGHGRIERPIDKGNLWQHDLQFSSFEENFLWKLTQFPPPPNMDPPLEFCWSSRFFSTIWKQSFLKGQHPPLRAIKDFGGQGPVGSTT